MSLKVLLLVVLSSSLVYSLDQIKSVDIEPSYYSDLTPYQLAQRIADRQSQIIAKAVNHYLKTLIKQEMKTISDSRVKQEIRTMFSTEKIRETSRKVEEYMRQRLQQKLGNLNNSIEIKKLSDSFQEQIKSHPDDYFITFDMYDLLIDEE